MATKTVFRNDLFHDIAWPLQKRKNKHNVVMTLFEYFKDDLYWTVGILGRPNVWPSGFWHWPFGEIRNSEGTSNSPHDAKFRYRLTVHLMKIGKLCKKQIQRPEMKPKRIRQNKLRKCLKEVKLCCKEAILVIMWSFLYLWWTVDKVTRGTLLESSWKEMPKPSCPAGLQVCRPKFLKCNCVQGAKQWKAKRCKCISSGAIKCNCMPEKK